MVNNGEGALCGCGGAVDGTMVAASGRSGEPNGKKASSSSSGSPNVVAAKLLEAINDASSGGMSGLAGGRAGLDSSAAGWLGGGVGQGPELSAPGLHGTVCFMADSGDSGGVEGNGNGGAE